MAPVAAAISAKSSGATKSARARSSAQSMEWPGPAMKPSSDMHRFTTTLPLMSGPPSLRHRRTADLSRADACETVARGVTVQISRRSGSRDVPLQHVHASEPGRATARGESAVLELPEGVRGELVAGSGPEPELLDGALEVPPLGQQHREVVVAVGLTGRDTAAVGLLGGL